jgi:hypothetical protein
MSWESRMLQVDAPDFRSRVEALLRQQIETWPMLRDAVVELEQVKYKTLKAKGLEFRAQFNPKRIVSVSANVGAAAIRRRPCFLCLENLPPEEKGIPFGENFIALCNPFPILPKHLVVSSRTHTPQTIAGNIGTMLDLARELGDGWFTFYNGPRCGASAPDHLHFQACERETVPLLREVSAYEPGADFRLRGLNALMERRADKARLERWFERVMERLRRSDEEPMVNVVVAYERSEWTLILFPRRKHRPSCYDAEGKGQIKVSPGAIDLLGVLVVPDPLHFARIAPIDLAEILDEILLEDDEFEDLLDEVREWE